MTAGDMELGSHTAIHEAQSRTVYEADAGLSGTEMDRGWCGHEMQSLGR